ncbi:hypothetical protein GYMLUDRAFT_269789 [Collybiopsis luxurians FD-317 M1]|nr:hypothetical protein GYMLUDRAFT_269789 [Collybiopsis luxurians FD-317 M1]
MEVINSRSALLSNYEVLELLRQLESDHLARTKTAIRIKKEEEASGLSPSSNPTPVQVSENVRTIQVEAIQYLASDYLPTSSQTADGITRLVKDLASYDLTKGEKLQIVNLAPTQPVEIYTIVEEMEDRLSDDADVICARVAESLTEAPLAQPPIQATATESFSFNIDSSLQYTENDMDAGVGDEMVFDDTGEGVGVEGDLDHEED